MPSKTPIVRRASRIAVVVALTSAAAGAPARAQLGAYAGCTVYTCYRFTLSEVSRSGPGLPFPGVAPGAYPNNVPSYLVQYQMDVTARVLPQAVADGITGVTAFLPWFFNDGRFGDGGCCALFGRFDVAGLTAGTTLAWSSATSFVPDMSGYVPVGAPAGTTGVSLGLFGFELYDVGGLTIGANDLTIAPVTTTTPEPATVVLLSLGLAGVAGARRLTRRR